jgi:hypothetical protein
MAQIIRHNSFPRILHSCRAEALRRLLTNPNLKAFSRLVMDAATARELLK